MDHFNETVDLLVKEWAFFAEKVLLIKVNLFGKKNGPLIEKVDLYPTKIVDLFHKCTLYDCTCVGTSMLFGKFNGLFHVPLKDCCG